VQRINAVEANEVYVRQKLVIAEHSRLLQHDTWLRPRTIQRLKFGQLKAAVKENKPTLHVSPNRKRTFGLYVSLHPEVVGAISEVLARF
jgi:hypothetical protein